MSWSGFKKAVNRAGAHVIMKTTKSMEPVTDPEFDLREHNFGAFEKLTIELNEELSNFKSIFEDLIQTQYKLIKAFDSFYGDYNFDIKADNMIGINIEDNRDNNNKVNPRDGVSLQLLKNLHDIKANILPELNDPMDITVFHPIMELTEYNEEIHKLIKKRGRKKFDFEVAKTKLDKLQTEYNQLELSLREEKNNVSDINSNTQLDKMNEKIQRMTAEYANISDIYQDINQRLKHEIDEYIALRFSLLDPSFESFIKIQLKVYSDFNEKFNHGIQIDAQSKEDHETGKIDQRLDEILNKMKALDINNL